MYLQQKEDIMNKSDLINNVAKELKVSKAEAGRNVEAVLGSIKKSIKSGGLTLVGFGSFNVVKRAARKGRNPQTGKEIKIKAKNVVRFRVGKDLKTLVDKK